MWIFSITLFLQITTLFASYNTRTEKCGVELGNRAVRGGSGHSTGKEESTFKQAWAVVFLIDDNDGGQQIHCSGSIIDKKHIITAAHCFYPKDSNGQAIDTSKLTIMVGTNDPFSSKRSDKGRKHKIKNFKVHDKYDLDTRAAYYDLAIVEVTKPFSFKRNVWPVCLPETINEDRNHFFRQTVVIIGYGPMRGDDDKDRTALTRLDLTVQNAKFCSKKYTVQTTDSNYLLLQNSLPDKFRNPSVFCAQNQGLSDGTCGGDSGGPVVQFDTTETDKYKIPRWVQVAAVHGSAASCDGSRFPSIFVRLDERDVLTWIYQMVWPERVGDLEPKEECDDYDYDGECDKPARPSQSSSGSRPRPQPKPERPRPRPAGNDYAIEGDCEYKCEADKSCRVKYRGSGGGACFPASFGGGCVGTPSKCEDCNKKVDCSNGATSDSSINNGGGACSEGTCNYECKEDGGCKVRFEPCKRGYQGVKLSSCFPEAFGGSCTNEPPTFCTQCKFKCLRKEGQNFSEKV